MTAAHASSRRRRRPDPVRLCLALAGMVLILAAGCTSEPPINATAPPAAPAEERSVFVALGGDETLTRGLEDGFRVAWTRQVFNSFPGSTVYVNVATENATVRAGLDEQLAAALELRPTVATVWFGAADAQQGTNEDRFVAELTDLTTALLDVGTEVLLVANTGDGSSVAFAARIEQVASDTGATYVAAPGPEGDPSDAGAQDGIAASVIRGLDS